MQSCPNCGAPLSPYIWRCEYCRAYIWDTEAMDFEDGHPCFVKFKTPQGTITALARPRLETAETYSVSCDCTDAMGNTLMNRTTMKGCDISVRFQCCPGENGELMRIDVDNDKGGESNG